MIDAILTNAADLRNVDWGISSDSVAQLETDPLATENTEGYTHIAAYKTTCMGLDAAIKYWFYKDTLYYAEYIFLQNYTNCDRYLADYSKLKSALTAKYGEPAKDIELFSPPYEKGDGYFSTALRSGKASFMAEWSAPRTSINLLLSGGNNYTVIFALAYSSSEYAKRFNELLKDEAISNDL